MHNTLMDYLRIYPEKWSELTEEFLRHLSMTGLSVILALLFAVPIGIAITHRKRLASVVIGIANIMQSIPCMALLGLGIPFFGIGERLAVFMVFVYAFLPILKNTYTGIASISPQSLEVARGIGMTRSQQLFRVELPMAFPYMMSGIRIAAVSAVGTMTIAAFAGANGLGWFIVLGMNSRNYPMIMMGAVASSVMALGLDFLLGLIERAVTSEGLLPPSQIKNLSKTVRHRRKAMAFVLCAVMFFGSLLGYAESIAPAAGKNETAVSGKRLVVGSSNFTESILLGNLYAELIEANTDYQVDRKFGLSGAAVCFDALQNGDIDMFVEYTGTALMNLLGQPMDTDKDRVYQTVQKLMLDEHNIATSKPLGFNNTYVMSVKPEVAEKYGLETLSDLIEQSPELRLGCTVEFIQREDCLPLLEKKYNAKFKSVSGLDASLRYDAIEADEVDVIDAFSTDGLLSKLDLKPLTDDLSFFPPYYAVNFADNKLLSSDEELAALLSELDGKIDEKKMASMNAAVDIDGRDPADVAHEFLVTEGLVAD